MLDLKGVKMVTGEMLKHKHHLKRGQEFRLVFSSKFIGDHTFAPIDFSSDLAEKITIGSKVFIDYGAVCLEVIGLEDEAKFETRLKGANYKNKLIMDRKIMSFQGEESTSLMDIDEEESKTIERHYEVKDVIREEDEF